MLAGSLRRAGTRLRITAQLIDTTTDFPLWSERYDREMKDVFEVQDEIARSIAQALRITLPPHEERVIGRKPTENTQAYDFYLRGRAYTRRFELDFALHMLEQAIKLDFNFALAHIGVAWVCSMILEFRDQSPRWLARGVEACDRALALEPQSPEALAARARLYYSEQKYDEAVRLARTALSLKPSCEGAYDALGRALFASGRYGEAADVVGQGDRDQRRRLQPVHPLSQLAAAPGASRGGAGADRAVHCGAGAAARNQPRRRARPDPAGDQVRADAAGRRCSHPPAGGDRAPSQ